MAIKKGSFDSMRMQQIKAETDALEAELDKQLEVLYGNDSVVIILKRNPLPREIILKEIKHRYEIVGWELEITVCYNVKTVTFKFF